MNRMEPAKKIELLAPAKDYESAVAAVDYGADAVYISAARSWLALLRRQLRERIARVDWSMPAAYGVRSRHASTRCLATTKLADAERRPCETRRGGRRLRSSLQDSPAAHLALPVEAARLDAGGQHDAPRGAVPSRGRLRRVILERALSPRRDPGDLRGDLGRARSECRPRGICVATAVACFLSRSMSTAAATAARASQPAVCVGTHRSAAARPHRREHLFRWPRHELSHRYRRAARRGRLSSSRSRGGSEDALLHSKRNVVPTTACGRRGAGVRPQLRRASAGESLYDFAHRPRKRF